MSTATITEVRQVGLAVENTRGTLASSVAKYMSLTKDSNIDFTTKLLPDPALRGYSARFASFAGAQIGKGPFKTPVRASDIVYFMKMLLGVPSASVEQASFVVSTGINDTLDFIATATQYHATVAGGTYLAGQTQADTGSLCQLLYAAITGAEGSGTYTVHFSRTTGLFTITKSTGTFSLLLSSGTNAAKSIGKLLGFATPLTDQTGADTYSGTVVQNPPFKHSWSQSSIAQLPSYSLFINRGFTDASNNTVKAYNNGCIAKLKISGKDDSPLEGEADLLAQLEATSAISWTPSYVESPVLMFSGSTVKVAGSASAVPNVNEWSVELDPGVVPFRPLSQQQYPYDFLARGPFMAKGDMKVYFMTEAERVKFINDSLTSLEFINTGSIINPTGGAAVLNTLELLLQNVEYEAFPFGDEGGFLGANVKYNAPGAFSAGAFVPVVTAYVINNLAPASW